MITFNKKYLNNNSNINYRLKKSLFIAANCVVIKHQIYTKVMNYSVIKITSIT